MGAGSVTSSTSWHSDRSRLERRHRHHHHHGQQRDESDASDTLFLRLLATGFTFLGQSLVSAPWTWMLSSLMVAGLLSSAILFTPLSNDIGDFTPAGARAHSEDQIYRRFFADRGSPKAFYVFVRPKPPARNLLDPNILGECVELIDAAQNDVMLEVDGRPEPFTKFCHSFCHMNEPVRLVHVGFIVHRSNKLRAIQKALVLQSELAAPEGNSSEGTSRLDIAYPVSSMFGMRFFVDFNLFGVQLGNSTSLESDSRALLSADLIVIQLRAELPASVSRQSILDYERALTDRVERRLETLASPSSISALVLTDSRITGEIVRAGLTLLPFLGIGFAIMSAFASLTMLGAAAICDQAHWHKVILAISACVCPFVACGAALGTLFWTGTRFGSTLCVTPFLVLAIGVDDAFLMVNAWQQIRARRRLFNPFVGDPEGDLRATVIEMLVETGPSITITTVTNVVAFGVGAWTSTPEIQLFSIANAAALLTDYIFQLTIYAAIMVLVGRAELERERRLARQRDLLRALGRDEKPTQTSRSMRVRHLLGSALSGYCNLLAARVSCLGTLLLLALYWYGSVLGILGMRAELEPAHLFLQDSPVAEMFRLRADYIIPRHTVCWVLIDRPGDVFDPTQQRDLLTVAEAFESHPFSVGNASTKLWLRDYARYVQSSIGLQEEEDYDNDDDDDKAQELKSARNQLREFLAWPEFSFWAGFVQTTGRREGDEPLHVRRFFFTTAFASDTLHQWSARAQLLNDWRAISARFARLNVSVYEEDARFLDLIPELWSTTGQSAVCTLVAMILCARLFIAHPGTLAAAGFGTASTALGVFGALGWWNVQLDPVVVSASVMSIGFAVDVPAHIAYHYSRTDRHLRASDRLRLTLASVGLPVAQASASTLLVVLALLLVQLHMSVVFAKTMLLVLGLSLLHGVLVIPVLFFVFAGSSHPRRQEEKDPPPVKKKLSAASSAISSNSSVFHVAVNYY